MSHNANQEQALFEEAVKYGSDAERAAFLDQACRGQPELRARLDLMVEGFLKTKGFLTERPDQHTLFAEEAIGTVIGRYKLREKIGEGGCGVVYVGEQQEPVRRLVALKVIKLGMDTKSVIARFEAERQALAMMDHPNIAKVLDAGATETGRPFFVMELVRGIKITDYCDQNNLPTRARLDLFVQVCRAVQHAHQKGIIHRDLKPSNILVTLHDGVPVPKVIDFGIAKATAGRLTELTVYTELNQFIGTPAYMSPEQAEMSGLDIDTRSDVYSLGVLLYELLTGKTPFDTQALLAAGLDAMRRTIRESEPVRPSTRLGTMAEEELTTTAKRRGADAPRLISLLRGDLDWVVMKALEKDRARRYETVNGFARDIERHLNTEPVLARPPSRLYEFQKTVRRHKLGFAATAAVITALVVGALVSSWEAVRARRAEREQGRLLESEQKARKKADAQERIARQRAYASDVNLAQQVLAMNEFAHGEDLLNHQRPDPGQEDLRGWEWRYLWQFCQSDALYELCRKSNAISSLAVSADGKWIAIGELRQGGLSVMDLRTRQQIARLRAGEEEVITAFSPRHSLLAFTATTYVGPGNSQCTIRLWDAETRQTVGEEIPLSALCRRIAFAADGQTLFTFTADDRLTLWRVPGGEELRSLPAPLQSGLTPPIAAAVAPDGSLAVHAAPDGWLRALDLMTGKERWKAKAADEFVWALAVSPDGRTIVSSGSSSVPTLRLWDAASGKEIGPPLAQRGQSFALVFWPDGKKVASSARTIRLWDVSDPGQLRQLGRPIHGHQDLIWTLALLPDQSMLVSGSEDGSVQVWDTTITRHERGRVTLPALLSAWRFASDSQSILTLDQRGQVAKWQGNLFQERRLLFEIGTNILQANFSQDGRWLAVAPTNGLVQVWDVPRGALSGQFASSTKRMTFNSPGMLFLTQRKKLLILDEADTLHEWDITNWRETSAWRTHENAPNSMTVAVSPDEATCVTLGRSGKRCPISLRNMVTGEERIQALDFAEVEDCAFSPDGKLFAAAASSAGGAKVWETATLRQTAALSFRESTFSVCFSPDGKRVVTGAGDRKAVKLWDPESGQELLTLDGESTFFWPTAFSPDGKTLGSMNYKGVLHLWHAPSWGEIELAERLPEAASRR